MKNVDIAINKNTNCDQRTEELHMEPDLMTRSMFGSKSTLYKSGKRNSLYEFDGIRSILSHSKVQENWEPYVEDDGSLFYVNVEENNDVLDSRPRKRYKKHRSGKRRISRDHHYVNDQGVCNCQNEYFCSGLCHGRVTAINDIHLYDNAEDTPNDLNMNYVKENVKNENSLCYLREQWNVLSQQNVRNVELTPKDDVGHYCTDSDLVTGIVMCQKQYGITLCEHNLVNLPTRSETKQQTDIIKTRRLVVEDIIPNSPAANSKQIAKGDILLSLNDVDISLVNLGKTFSAITTQPISFTFHPFAIGETILPEQETKETTDNCPTETTCEHTTNKSKAHIKKSILHLVSQNVNPKLTHFFKKLTLHFIMDSDELKVR